MTAPFEAGDVLEISTASFKGRRFTVVESNRHRTRIVGKRGAERVLVFEAGSVDGQVYVGEAVDGHIHEDDGARVRAQACSVTVVSDGPAPEPKDAQPATLERRDLVALLTCESGSDLASWVLSRPDMDRHALDGSMIIYRFAARMLAGMRPTEAS